MTGSSVFDHVCVFSLNSATLHPPANTSHPTGASGGGSTPKLPSPTSSMFQLVARFPEKDTRENPLIPAQHLMQFCWPEQGDTEGVCMCWECEPERETSVCFGVHWRSVGMCSITHEKCMWCLGMCKCHSQDGKHNRNFKCYETKGDPCLPCS